MNENKISIIIDRPVSDVFVFTITPANTHKWVNSIIKEETNEWPIKIGTIYKNSDSDGKWSEYVVVNFIVNKIFEFRQKEGLYFVRYEYKELSQNKTELIYTEWVEGGTLTDPFSADVLKKLKNLLES